jgi:hypothetical protein
MFIENKELEKFIEKYKFAFKGKSLIYAHYDSKQYPYDYVYLKSPAQPLVKIKVVYKGERFFVCESSKDTFIAFGNYRDVNGVLSPTKKDKFKAMGFVFMERSKELDVEYHHRLIYNWAAVLDRNFLLGLPVNVLLEIKKIIDTHEKEKS